MEDSDFSQEFFGFIRAAIPSVSAAELLLLLFKHPDRWWTLGELLRELPADVRISETDAVACLETLRSYGLVELDDEKRVRYRAASDVLDAQVSIQSAAQPHRENLAVTCPQRRPGRVYLWAMALSVNK